MLIAGLYEQEQDPYSPPAEDPYQILGAARGSVRALTYREFTVEVPQEKVVDSPTGQRWEAYSLVVFGLRIPLGLNTFPEEGVSQWKESTPWSPLGKDLPLVWEKTTYVSLEEERVLLEEEAWKTLTEEEQTMLVRLTRQFSAALLRSLRAHPTTHLSSSEDL